MKWPRIHGLCKEEKVFQLWDNCKINSGGCLEFLGRRDEKGYGRVMWEGKNDRAHRLVFEALNGIKLKTKEYICHKCDNPSCINIDHLFLGDQTINMRDMAAKKRHFNSKKVKCKNGHPFDRVDSRGNRNCSICHKELLRNYSRKYRRKYV